MFYSSRIRQAYPLCNRAKTKNGKISGRCDIDPSIRLSLAPYDLVARVFVYSIMMCNRSTDRFPLTVLHNSTTHPPLAPLQSIRWSAMGLHKQQSIYR